MQQYKQLESAPWLPPDEDVVRGGAPPLHSAGSLELAPA